MSHLRRAPFALFLCAATPSADDALGKPSEKYESGGRKDTDGKLVHFKRVNDDLVPALTDRFENEMKDALEMLKT
jgi:hypothetical protein